MTTAYDEVLLSLGLEPSSGTRAPYGGARCGTRSGYERHRNRREEPCDQCRAANTEYKRRRKAAPKDPTAMPPINHGTEPGYRQHEYRGERPCEECRQAYRAVRTPYQRELRRRQRARRGGEA